MGWSGAAALRAAAWTVRALLSARAQLRRRPVEDVRLPDPPAVPASAVSGVEEVIDAVRPSCLSRSLVRQAWDAAHGRERDLVIGVAAPGGGFRAHAWLEGDDDPDSRGLAVIARHPPRP